VIYTIMSDEQRRQGPKGPRPSRLQPKSLAGQEKSEERISHTVELFDEPGGDFRCNAACGNNEL
jgi:hypothetical protein